jgi:hypothetical protein
LRPAHQSARQRAGRLAIAIGDGARHDGCTIAERLLQQALAAGRQVPLHHRRLDPKLVEVDDIEVGLPARRDKVGQERWTKIIKENDIKGD